MLRALQNSPQHTVSPVHESKRAEMIKVSDLVVNYGAVSVVKNIGFDVRQGEHLTLLGPSGCGKTTTLRAIAGLERPTSGAISINGKDVYSSIRRVEVPVEKRGISVVFQSYAIWPHMSVFENVAYGLKVRRRPKDEVAAAVERALSLIEMTAFADRPASHLSGGQQQRIALARAIAFSPEVILFDEPLSNLDAKLRTSMRTELRELQKSLGFTSVYVTHDQEEAFSMSDRVIVMNGGHIEQEGTPDEIYNQPRTRFVADFVGSANVITGRVREYSEISGQLTFEASDGQVLRAQAFHRPSGSETQVAVRTALINLTGAPDTIGGNRLAGTITRKTFHGDFIEYSITWGRETMIVRRPPTEAFEHGESVVMTFPMQSCVLLEN